MLDAYDFRARTLWPELGRFGQEDPEGLVPGGPIGNRPGSKSPELNLYAFARGNPLTYVDPSGRWPSKGPILAHQQAIDDALSFLPASDRAILKAQQAAIDAHQFQGTADSPIHAMTPLGRPRESAIRQANNFVRGGIILARQLEASGKHVEALKVLGDAMHTLQDSTSPSHRGFQEWSEEWGATTKEGRRHVDNELYYPGPRSELVDITRRAWSYFTGALDMPSDFFSVSAREQAHATVMNALPE
jgi:RHS repeat-associated protein